MPEIEPENQNVVEETRQVTYNYLYASEDFVARIKAFKTQNLVASVLYELIVKLPTIMPETKGTINCLGVSVDDPTKISYITQERAELAREKQEEDRIWNDKNYRYHSGAGKVIRKVLTLASVQQFKRNFNYSDCISIIQESFPLFRIPEDCNNFESLFTEANFDQFNNLFRTEGYKQGDANEVIFVRGHWIKDMYLESNYASLSGTLGNSCMRYQRTNAYLDIYVKNPYICKLAVLLNSEGKVHARALVWTIDGVDYHDRIYYTSDLIHDRMKAFFLTNNIQNCASQYPDAKMIKIEADTLNKDFDKRVLLNHDYYPYMDNLKYMNEERTVLTNDWNCFSGEKHLILNSTGGGYESTRAELQSCDCCGREIDEDCSYYIDIRRDSNYGETFCEDCAAYSEIYGGYITRDNAVYLEGREEWALTSECVSDYAGIYIYGEDAIELTNGQYADRNDPDLCYYNDGDAFIIGHSDFDYVEYNGRYYKEEDCVEDREGDTYPKQFTTEYEGEIWLIENLDRHLNLNLI